MNRRHFLLPLASIPLIVRATSVIKAETQDSETLLAVKLPGFDTVNSAYRIGADGLIKGSVYVGPMAWADWRGEVVEPLGASW